MKRTLLVTIILGITLAVVGCNKEEIKEIKQQEQNIEITIEKKPKKVICLYNSYLDLWYDAGGEVIGRITTRGEVPEEAKDVEIVGSMMTPNIEKIISIEPDLVILRSGISSQRRIIPLLEENKISYLDVEYDNFDEYLETFKIFTDINEREDLYIEKGLKLKEDIENIITKVPKEEKPTVLLLYATANSVEVKLPTSFVGDMLQDLGAENIAYDTKLIDEETTTFSMEKIIERNPDYIFVQTGGDVEKTKDRLIKDVESNPAWNYLNAVKEGKYIFLPKELYHYKPNDRYDEAYEGLAKILYPNVFK